MNKLISKKNLQNIAIAFGIAIFFMVDRWLKLLAQNIGPEAHFSLVRDWFSFSYTPNYLIAFSLPFSGILLNITIIMIIAAIIYLIFYLILNKKQTIIIPADLKITIILLTIVLFGAISNIQDRLLYGHVIDYLELRYFTVFNLADIMISIGTMILITKTLKIKK